VRLLKRRAARGGDALKAISQAVSAGAEADERLASATEVRGAAAEQAAHEQRTIVSELRAMRERNHLADLIVDSVKRGTA
jgi:hypothetical protein